MARPYRALEAELVRRGRGRCEYCHFPEAVAELLLHLDHIIAEKHRGPTTAANLAWACFSYNLFKGPNIAGMNPVTGKLKRLIHPRQDVWSEHFAWDGIWLRGGIRVPGFTCLGFSHAVNRRDQKGAARSRGQGRQATAPASFSTTPRARAVTC